LPDSHTTSTTLRFSKEEWLVILELSTLWDFHEFRKLAKEHLERQLDDPIERIIVGRAAYIPRWVVEGYECLVTRSECISEQESERIGHLTTVRLYILRHERCFEPAPVPSRFGKEVHQLEQMEKDHMSAEERRVEEEKRLEEERQRHDREEQQRLAEEKARAEREEEERKEREEMECREREERRIEEKRIAVEAYRKAEEERLKQECAQEERKGKEKEERRQKEEERLQMEADEHNQKKEELRLEADRIAKELAALEKREEGTRLQEERERERAQNAEGERLRQQSKAPTFGGFGSGVSSVFGGAIDILEEQRSPPTQPWLGIKQDVNENSVGRKKKPSISSIAKPTTGPTSLSRKHSFQWGNAGATTTTSAFEFAVPVNNAAFGIDLQDINTANTAPAAEQEKGTPIPPPPLMGDENPTAEPWDIETSSTQKKAGEEPTRTLTPAPEEPVDVASETPASTRKKRRERKWKKYKSLLDLSGGGEDTVPIHSIH
jgi:actin-related protein